MTGISRPTMAPVLRAKLPEHETTCSQVMSPLSVFTSHSPEGSLLNGGHRGVAIDFSAPAAGTLGQRLGQIGGLDIAIVGMLDGADDAIGLAQRPDFLHLLGRQAC